MKKYLMTWYGLTDFRASLGLEETTGPVLGALLSESYSGVVILGFTHQNKPGITPKVFQERLKSIKDLSFADKREFIDIYANTTVAHHHFNHWLEGQLNDAGKKTEVHLQSINLNHLNDTENIYEAATRSLDTISSVDGEKLVTLYLSPGTPVMAFVWAFAALRYPALKKRLIAASQPGKPPEEITLPNEWLEWHGKQLPTTIEESDQYDVIFHLFGEQRMPSLLGITQFSSKQHIFVNSPQFPADVMVQFIGKAEYGELPVDPFDPESVRTTILDLIATMPSDIRIGFNLTGGTKLMYMGGLAACRKVNATPFYFNSKNNKVIYLNDFRSMDTKPILSVETFINLNGNNLFVSKAGYWNNIPDIDNPSRTALTNELWFNRSPLSQLYPKIVPFNDDSGRNFKFRHKHISVELKDGHRVEVIINSRNGKENIFRFENWPDFAKYITGGWFEEYSFMTLRPIVESGFIKDIRIGLEVSFKENPKDTTSSSMSDQLSGLFGEKYQELDVIFTDGRCLYIIECKAGNVKSQDVMKLQNIARYFGGIESKPVLAFCFPPRSKVVRKKIEESETLQSISGDHLFKKIEEMIPPQNNHQ